jgi:thioesterase domain-containing protein
MGEANLENKGLRADLDWEKVQSAAGTRLGEILERVGRASRVAGANFVPKHYRGSAVVVRSSEQWPTPYQDDFLGWKPIVHGAIENFEVAGDHQSIFEEPDVRELAASINARLRKASAKTEEAA